MPDGNITIKAVFARNASTHSSSGGSSGNSYREQEYDFWLVVKERIEDAGPGDTVRANARDYDRMPFWVMDALREADGVTLHITWNGGEDIVIPAEAALTPEAGRIYYPLSYLEGMTFTSETPVNPETGGVLTVTAPTAPVASGGGISGGGISGGGTVEITDPRRGLAETPELRDEGVEQTIPGVYEPETTTGAPVQQAAAGGIWIAVIATVAAVAAAAGIGSFWFWKRKTQQ